MKMKDGYMLIKRQPQAAFLLLAIPQWARRALIE